MLKALQVRKWFGEFHPRELSLAAGSLILGVASIITLASAAAEAGSTAPPVRRTAVAPVRPAPAPQVATLPPIDGMDLSFQAAVALNNAMPLSAAPNPAAAPFTFAASVSKADRDLALDCLTQAVYYEAATETPEGQAAVAQVVLNRLRHPAFPKTVCGVVFEGSSRVTGCQFTFTCDGALGRRPSAVLWTQARKVASEALNGKVVAQVGHATHYHTQWVTPPWSRQLTKVQVIGAHIFYRWNGGAGLPGAFSARYVGGELAPNALPAAQVQLAALTPREVMTDTPSAPGPGPTEEPATDMALAIVERIDPEPEASAKAVEVAELTETPVPAELALLAPPPVEAAPTPVATLDIRPPDARRSRLAVPRDW